MADFYVDKNGNISKKKKKDEEKLAYKVDINGNVTAVKEDEDDIAPVKNTEEEKRTWFQAGAFDDGYQFGDILKTGYSTIRDVRENLWEGALGIGEKTVDAGAYLVGGVGKLVGADSFADTMSKFIQKDIVNEEKISQAIVGNWQNLLLPDNWKADDNSLLGEKTDDLMQSGGQLAAQVGLQLVGVPWYLTTGVTSFGAEAENAMKNGATYGEAGISAAVSTASEILTEKLFKGSGLGEKGLINTAALTKGISNKIVNTLASFGVDMLAEGAEEVVSQFASTLGQQLTYEKESTWSELLNNEDAMDKYISQVGESLLGEEARNAYGEAFIGGAVLGGGMNSVKAVKSIKKQTDYNTGRTDNEEAVFKHELEARIAEEEADGKKLTQSQKAKIEAEVEEDLEKGRISTDTIEKVLGGDTYKAFDEGVRGFDSNETYKEYQKAVAEEKAIREEYEELQKVDLDKATLGQDHRLKELEAKIKEFETKPRSAELRAQLEPEIQRINGIKKQLQQEVSEKVKGDRLSEGYRELQRSTEKFQADVSKYKNENARKTIQNLMDGGIANNTNEFHEFADMLAKWSADKGLVFDMTDNQKLLGTRYAKQNADVNGFLRKDGTVVLNKDSGKRLNSVAGHEITHVLEGTKFYQELADAVKEYATKKGEYDTRLKKITELYAKNDPDADPVKELTADLVGDYIFTDKAFIENLSVNHRNVFQYIWDEIKYMAKTVAAGSKEERILLRAKKNFADAYRASGQVQKTTAEAKNSLNIKHTDGTVEEIADARDLTNEKAIDYLKKAKSGTFRWDAYIPVRKDTPQVIIDTLAQVNETVSDNSLVMQVRKAQKAMASDNPGTRKGRHGNNVRGHNLTPEEIVEIVNKLDDPTAIIYQTNREDPNGNPLPNNVAVFVEYKVNGNEGVAVIEFESSINPEYIGREYGDTRYHTVVTIFEPDVERDGMPYDYAAELLDNPNNIELDIKRRQSAGSAIGKKHPNTSNELPSKDIITENSEKSSGEVKNSLSPAQEEYFKDSVVRDEDGNLKVMYHGTSRGGHTVFDPYGKANYGLFGAGSYFTDNPDIAQSYTKKGKGTSPQVYETYLNIKNPIDMDAPADAAAWAAAMPDVDFPESGTNEDFYRAMEQYFEDMEYPRWEAAETAMGVIEDMGFDGITHVGGGRVDADGVRHRVYIAFQPDQIKAVDNVNPTEDADIRYSLSENSDGRELTDAQAEFFKESKIVDDNGNLRVMYHGSRESFDAFDRKKAKSSGTYGSGFYFSNSKSHAGTYGETYEVYLNIKNPLQDGDQRITKDQLRNFVQELADNEDYGLDNYGYGATVDSVTDSVYGKSDFAMLLDLNITAVGNMVEAIELFNQVNGTDYDGIIAPTETVAFYPEQIKRVDNLNPTEDVSMMHSLSNSGAAPARRGRGYGVYGDRIRVHDSAEYDFAPLGEYTAPAQADVAPVADVATDTNVGGTADDDYAPYSEEVANSLSEEGLANITDADAPPEMDAPYYGYESEAAPDNPFEERDIKDVGNRSVKAYMYENPEVKPFFQAEANVMLGELNRTIKGERVVDAQVLYDTNGEAGVYGTKRHTSDDIAYLRDSLNYSYAEIEKGLKAIIEDDGKENNAVSKRIEFLLNDRLLNGYRDMDTGDDYPPNTGYVQLLNDKQIMEYNEEARARLFENADAYAPPVDDIAPVREDIAPARANAPTVGRQVPLDSEYEAIRPQRSAANADADADIAPVYGEKMVRVDSGNGRPGEKQRKWVGTSTGSEAVGGKILPDDLNQDTIHYQPISNKDTLSKANSKLDGMGYEASVAYFNSQFANKRVALEDIALGERLIQEAVKRGDTKTAGELIQNVALLGTELGQKVQALSIIKRLTPEGQLGLLRKTIERGKTKGDKVFEGVQITQEMIDKILAAYGKDGTYDQDKLNKAVEDVKQQIADQMKVTKLEKVNAWRYLAMLGNPKTHIRNLVSNVAMRGTLSVKNAVARTIESVAPIGNRTKTWRAASKDVTAFAQKTVIEMKDVLSDDSKYDEAASIKEKRQIFQNKVLNAVYEFNSNFLTKEDWWFSKPAFVNSLKEFLTANGIRTAEDIQANPELVEKAKLYATEQSQIATFRQYSWLANKIGDIERHNTATNIAVGSILPFKKTPVNIAKAGLSYSPLGFMKSLTYDVAQVKNGKMEASELVDHLSQNVTGSALTLVGYLLASAGFLSGGGDDDKEGKYDYQLGEQAYAVNIGDKSYSLSWLSPVAMPLFVGANAFEQLVEGKEWNGDVVVETLAQTLDPLNEMSFLSGLTSVLSSYDSGMQKFAGILETMAQNYTTQFVPTALSQVATAMDDTKRSTKVDGDSDNKFVDGTINKLVYKIPFLRQTLEPSTDIWGNEVKQTENVLARALETFIAPWSKRENIGTDIDAEIKKLYSDTGDTGVIPSVPYNYVNYDGEKYEMSGKEFTEFKNVYGQTAYNMLRELMKMGVYAESSAEERADMVNKVYDYARDEAKRKFLAEKGVVYTNAKANGEEYYREDSIKGAIENNMTPDEYSYYRENPEKYAFLKENGVSYADYTAFDDDTKDVWSWAYNNPDGFALSKAAAKDVVTYRKYAGDLKDIEADKDSNGNSISGSRKEKVFNYINNLDADYGEKIILFKNEYNADDTYNYDIIEYLDSREDISYEEMVTILTKLGFKVSGNNITW